MFALSKPYVCYIYLNDSGKKKEVNMDKIDVKIKQFWDSTIGNSKHTCYNFIDENRICH